MRRVEQFYGSSDHANAEPLSKSVESIERLWNHFELHIVTARDEVSREFAVRWLQKNFPGRFADIHFTNTWSNRSGRACRTKEQVYRGLGAEVVVDDAGHHIEEALRVGARAFMMDAPWNRKGVPMGAVRVYSWQEVEDNLIK